MCRTNTVLQIAELIIHIERATIFHVNMSKVTFAFLLSYSAVALAAQDSAYYPGFNNPNVQKSDLYYREAYNVLEDLNQGKFAALFIAYHGCVWSEYGHAGRDEVDGSDWNSNNNNYQYGGCPYSNGDEDENWYVGGRLLFRRSTSHDVATI